ncbi:M48 family metallopeptidase [Herbidospora mongoliensis]|uniref:M48 family metallopeptidase n=1 Tax=Herbidospora mongoliensis TaxID=688067 RepID=UPI0008345AE7|nr:M48 family metallopeptidase [Herbidospora mongoliensis]
MKAAAIGLAGLGVAIVAVVALTTPWRVLPAGAAEVTPDPVRDFGAAQIARADAFDAATSAPSYLSLGVSLVIAAVLVATPLGARLIGRLKGPWWLRALIGVAGVYLVSLAIRWPLGMWFETVLRDYGLSTQTWGTWTADRLKNFALQLLLSAVMVVVVIALARRWPRRWWIPASIGAFTLTLALSFLYPIVVEPVFNDFTPLPQGQLRASLLAMADRDGVPVDDVLVADASRRTTALNAYVSGFGATRRIVVYDTLLEVPEPEIELIVAHELGHAKTDDVLHGTLVGALGAAFGACALFVVGNLLRRRTGVPSLGDPKAATLLVGLVSLATLLSGPAQNLVSRHIEGRADAHALQLTEDPATFVAMQRNLAVRNISDLSPTPLEYVLYSSHPTAPQRIAMARSWGLFHGQRVP